RCGEKAFPYAFSRYESEQNSKIDIACELLSMVPKSSFSTYVLMDTWYPAQSVLETCALSGFHVISGIKTNRIIYPYGIRQSIKEFASHIHKEDTDLVTVGHASYHEGKLNFIENAVVLLCWDATQPMT
ncbi:transposase, partial [Aneurinibacillus migulanus]